MAVWKRLALVLAMAVGVAGAARADVVVGSKIDTEGTLLGNMILVALQANGIATEDRIALGGTPVVRKAITAGEIDIYPESTGNAAVFFNKADDPGWENLAAGSVEAKKLADEANKLD
ncbi:MAG: glycine betaine ABC transporter substrate-binding protein, partial [Geminicoccaceae bacterium]